MTKRPAVKFAISLEAELFDRLEASRDGEARSAFIARALDAALREPGEGQPVESGPANASGSIPRLSSSASRRAPGNARPAAAAADGQDGAPSAGSGGARQKPPDLMKALEASLSSVRTSAEAKRDVRPIPKAKGKR